MKKNAVIVVALAIVAIVFAKAEDLRAAAGRTPRIPVPAAPISLENCVYEFDLGVCRP